MHAHARFPTFADPVLVSASTAPQHRLQVVPLADTVAAVFFDTADIHALPTAKLAAWTRDECLCRPLISTRLNRADGGSRRVFLLPDCARNLCRDGLRITCDCAAVAEIDPMALQSPMVDSLALLAGLSDEGGLRLLRLLLTTGHSLFGSGPFGDFRDIVSHLLEGLVPPPLPLRAWCPLGARAALASYALPKGVEAGDLSGLVAIGSTGVRRLLGAEADVDTSGEERLLHLFLPDGFSPDSTLVSLSDAPIRLAGPRETQRRHPLGPWLSRRSPQLRKRVRQRLARIAQHDDTAAALLSEISCPAGSLPVIQPHLLCSTPTGLLYAIGANDPRHLLCRLILRTPEGDMPVALDPPLYHPRIGAMQLGFAHQAPGCEPGDEIQVLAQYTSGRLSRIARVTADILPADCPPLLRDLPGALVAPHLAEALCATLSARPAVQVHSLRLGEAARPASATLVAELGASFDYPYALAASLGGRQDVVLMLHHPDRRALPALRALGSELHAIYGIGVDLLDPGEDGVLSAERMRAAMSRVTTNAAIVLTNDLLPHGTNWLSSWNAELEGTAPVIAGTSGFDCNGAPWRDPASTAQAAGARPVDPMDVRHSSAIGLNGAARGALASMPLCVPDASGDIALLAAALRQDSEARVILLSSVQATDHAALRDVPEALRAAEDFIIAREAHR